MIEKAFAKRFGNYEHIIEGLPTEAIRTLTGAPKITIYHKDKDVESMWQMLNSHEKSDDFITASTESSDDAKRNLAGLVKGHSYTVLGTVKLTDGKRLVKIRNPWGKEGFSGAYGGKNTLWDETAKKEAGYLDKNDGIFFTDIETYVMSFSETLINIDVEDWATTKFMKLDDNS